MRQPPAILFVCLGNICRSPLAEGAFRAAAARVGRTVEVDSAGSGDWHIGHPPDPRAQAVAHTHGIDISGLRARQVSAKDFARFTHIVALDARNLDALTALRPFGTVSHFSLLLDHVPGRSGQEVADPYYGSEEGFETTWRDVTEGAEGLIATLAAAK